MGQGCGVGRIPIREHGETSAIRAMQSVKRLLGQDIDLERGVWGQSR
jgi:hypothetical protein